jgi:hypothetical protein
VFGNELVFCMSFVAVCGTEPGKPAAISRAFLAQPRDVARLAYEHSGGHEKAKAYVHATYLQSYAVFFLFLHASSEPIALLCCRCTSKADSV